MVVYSCSGFIFCIYFSPAKRIAFKYEICTEITKSIRVLTSKFAGRVKSYPENAVCSICRHSNFLGKQTINGRIRVPVENPLQEIVYSCWTIGLDTKMHWIINLIFCFIPSIYELMTLLFFSALSHSPDGPNQHSWYLQIHSKNFLCANIIRVLTAQPP